MRDFGNKGHRKSYRRPAARAYGSWGYMRCTAGCLKRRRLRLRDRDEKNETETQIDLPVSAYISDKYIKESQSKDSSIQADSRDKKIRMSCVTRMMK